MTASPRDQEIVLPTILMVDDHLPNLIALRGALGAIGYPLAQATSGSEALAYLEQNDCGLILMDVQMPGLDGIETVRRLRKSERHRHTPVIFITALDQELGLASAAYAEGAVDYLVKPFRPEILRAKANALLSLERRARELQAREARVRVRELETERAELLVREQRARADADATRLNLQVSQEALRTQTEVTRAITDNATVGLVMMDVRQHCTFLNPAAERIFGFTLAELQGKPLHDFIHHTRPDGTPFPMSECPIDRALPERAQEAGEDVFVRSDGTFYPVAFTASPILDGGKPVGTVVELRDITEDKRRQLAERRRANHALLLGEIGAVLTRESSLRELSRLCSEALVRHMDAALACIWMCDVGSAELELYAGAGSALEMVSDTSVLLGSSNIGRIASEKQPYFTNDLLADARLGDVEWARRAGVLAFAGLPLLVGGRVLGVLAIFARTALERDARDVLASIGDTIAVGVERLRAEEASRESEARFRNMADHAPVMLWVTDANGKCTYLSRGWYDFTGQTEETGLGFGWLSAVHPDDAKRSSDVFLESNARAAGFRLEYRLLRKDGEYRWAIDSASPRFNAEGEFLGYIGSVIDISERKAAEDALAELNHTLEARVRERTAALQEANHELESFSYSVSHDLRAPLRHIGGFAQLLEKRSASALDEKSKQYLTTIHTAAQRGGQLVDDLLAFSRMGRTAMRNQSVSLVGLVDEVKKELAPEEEGRNVEWRVGALPSAEGDPAMLRIVIRNLLANALKYTRPNAQALIEIGAREGEAETEIFVRDNGVGFDMQFADKLFGVFQRLHSNEQFEGTGIGLATVRRIVQRHGGRVWANAAIGQGATFFLTLPRAKKA